MIFLFIIYFNLLQFSLFFVHNIIINKHSLQSDVRLLDVFHVYIKTFKFIYILVNIIQYKYFVHTVTLSYGYDLHRLNLNFLTF